MLGPKQETQGALFYGFSIDDHVPQDHLLLSIDRFVALSNIRPHLAECYSHTGRPSIDPELLIRMLLVGYCLGIRSERRLCEVVHLNLANRWFADWILLILGRTVRPFASTVTGVSATVTCCDL